MSDALLLELQDRPVGPQNVSALTRGDFQNILIIDIETRPAVTYQWSLWDQHTPLARLIEPSSMLSFAAKWYGHDEVIFSSDWTDGHEVMVERVHDLLTMADLLVTYNGNRFDIPWLKTEFVLAELPPPSPFASVDLFNTVRQFRFLSKKLDYMLKVLDLGAKVEHEGFALWTGCMGGDTDAQARMEEYNRGDVTELEKLYDALLPWIKGHPHVALYAEDGSNRCQRCGSTRLVESGTAYTPLGVFKRYQCGGCQSWHRGGKRIDTADIRAI